MRNIATVLLPLALTLASQGAMAQAAKPAGARSGETVYKTVCTACHETGVANAPKFGDQKAWAPLIAEGQPVLTGHAWVGVRAMPARGGSKDVQLPEFARAVAFMARGSGGDWKDPDAAMLKRIATEAEKQIVKAIREQQAMQRELHRLSGR